MRQQDNTPRPVSIIKTEYGEDVRFSTEISEGEPYVLIETACMRGEVLELTPALARRVAEILLAQADIVDDAARDIDGRAP